MPAFEQVDGSEQKEVWQKDVTRLQKGTSSMQDVGNGVGKRVLVGSMIGERVGVKEGLFVGALVGM